MEVRPRENQPPNQPLVVLERVNGGGMFMGEEVGRVDALTSGSKSSSEGLWSAEMPADERMKGPAMELRRTMGATSSILRQCEGV